MNLNQAKALPLPCIAVCRTTTARRTFVKIESLGPRGRWTGTRITTGRPVSGKSCASILRQVTDPTDLTRAADAQDLRTDAPASTAKASRLRIAASLFPNYTNQGR